MVILPIGPMHFTVSLVAFRNRVKAIESNLRGGWIEGIEPQELGVERGTPWKINMDHNHGRFGRWCSFLNGWFVGSMLIFRGVNGNPPVFLIYTTLAKCTIWMGPICLWWPLIKLLLASFINSQDCTTNAITSKDWGLRPTQLSIFPNEKRNATNSDAQRTSVNLRLQNQLMVNWWFGAWWFGFPLDPRKWKGLGFLGVPRKKSPNHRAPNHQFTISWLKLSQKKKMWHEPKNTALLRGILTMACEIFPNITG